MAGRSVWKFRLRTSCAGLGFQARTWTHTHLLQLAVEAVGVKQVSGTRGRKERMVVRGSQRWGTGN